MHRTFTLFLFISSMMSQSVVTYGQHDGAWRLAIDKNDVEVYLHRSSDFRVRSFRATTTVNMSLDSVEAILDDIQEYPSWQSNVKEANLVYKRSDSTYHILTRNKFSWPNKGRDLMWSVHKEWDRYASGLVYDQVCSSNTLPEKKNHGTAMQAFVSWRLVPQEEGDVKITMTMTVDRGGKIPSWLINMLSAEAPYQTLLNLKDREDKTDEDLSSLD